MYISIMLKTFFLYFFILLVYRLMGKKELGQLSIIDLIVTILIAELVAISIENAEDSIMVSVVPILVLVIVQISLSYINLKSDTIRNIFDGKPSVLIKKGKVDFTKMSKLRYSLDDLLSQLREKGVKSLDEVDYAVLENSGTLSVFEKTLDYPMPIILDGTIDYSVLKEIHKSEKWLYELLEKENLQLADVFYAFHKKNKTYIIKKEELL